MNYPSQKWESGSREMNLEAAAIQEVGGAGLHQTRTVEMQEGGGLGFILKIKPNLGQLVNVGSEGKRRLKENSKAI